jgi:hypothetical protein
MSEHRLDHQNATASRRNFLKTTGAVTAGALAGSLLPETAAASPAAPFNAPFNPATAGAMPTRNLGRTGHRPGIFSLGGRFHCRCAAGWRNRLVQERYDRIGNGIVE